MGDDESVTAPQVPGSTAPQVPGSTAPDEGGIAHASHPDDLPPEVAYPERAGEAGSALPRRLEAWRRRSAAGAVFTGMAFALRDVFEPPVDEPAVVLETSGTPPTDLPVEAELEDAPPRQTVVRIRPWLLDEETPVTGTEAGAVDRPERERTVAPPRQPRPRRRGRRS